MEQARANNTPLILGALVLGGLVLYKKVIRPDFIQPVATKKYVRRLAVRMPGVAFKGDDVILDLFIQNPNPTPMKIDAIVGDIYINYKGKRLKVGNADNYPRLVIRPLGQTKFLLTVKTKLPQLVVYFQDVFAGKATGQVVEFLGTITIDGRPWPVKETKKIS